jgi:hypothetical protein
MSTYFTDPIVSTSLEGSNDLSALQFAESGQYLGLLVAP